MMSAVSCVREITLQRVTSSSLVGISILATGAGVLTTTLVDPVTGTGYLLFGVSTGMLAVCWQQLRIAKSIASSVRLLREENDELRETNDDLRASATAIETQVQHLQEHSSKLQTENDRLCGLESALNKDIRLLRNAIGAVGEKGDDIIKRLRLAWTKYESENTRHASLLGAQARLQLMQIMQHFDKDTDLTLSASEMQAAQAYLRVAFPDGNLQRLMEMAADGVSLDALEVHLLPPASNS